MELAEAYLNRYQQAKETERLAVILEYRSVLETLSATDRQAARSYMEAHLPTLTKTSETDLNESIEKAEAILSHTLTIV